MTRKKPSPIWGIVPIALIGTLALSVAAGARISRDLYGVVNRFRIEARDPYGNMWVLRPKLAATNQGSENGNAWTTLSYFCVIGGEPWSGSYGDIEVYLEIWDARKISGRGSIYFEISRNGWNEMKVFLDGNLICTFDQLQSGHPNPDIGYLEGTIP